MSKKIIEFCPECGVDREKHKVEAQGCSAHGNENEIWWDEEIVDDCDDPRLTDSQKIELGY